LKLRAKLCLPRRPCKENQALWTEAPEITAVLAFPARDGKAAHGAAKMQMPPKQNTKDEHNLKLRFDVGSEKKPAQLLGDSGENRKQHVSGSSNKQEFSFLGKNFGRRI
jgi:hypothetical protein